MKNPKGAESMKLTLLGTGNASATKYYNTCFTISDKDEVFLVDAGGGNGILKILEEENIPMTSIHHVFVSHGHTDHVLGIIWILRIIAQLMHRDVYEGNLQIYCHKELKETINTVCNLMLPQKFLKFFGDRILFVEIIDGQEIELLGSKIRFMDLISKKMKQFGFVLEKNGSKLSFCGDVTLKKELEPLILGSEWLLHEAFCLYEERETFKPYEKEHGTVKDACELGERMKIKNLVLFHTEDSHFGERKELYLAEGKPYFSGNLYVPDDREIIELF